MGTIAATAYNLRPPLGPNQIVDGRGIPTAIEDKFRTNLQLVLQQSKVVVVAGATSGALQAAVNQGIQQGGGLIMLPAGPFSMNTPVSIPSNAPPLWIQGSGMGVTVLTRTANMPTGAGMFDISGSFVAISDMTIDGGTTVSVGLQYGVGFSTAINVNDPMAPSLTTNTSIWVHGNGNEHILIEHVLFQHAGGYSILLDATTGTISDIDILTCWFNNNRPTLFGTTLGQLIYGSWNGGILAKGDGRTSTSGIIDDLLVQGCGFRRGTGNQLWSHNYGFSRFNSNFRWLGNHFIDCGLDGMLVDCVSGGTVEGNVLRRIGYVTTDDTSQSIPRWLVGLNATGLDSGVVKGVNYLGNSFTSVNGGMIDLDTHCMGSVSSNICRIPYPDEPEYSEDQIAITGPTNSGSLSYGLNLAVNYPINEGGEYINFIGNTLLNLQAGAMRLYSARYCSVIGNIIQAPTNSIFAPIQMGPNGAASYNRCFGNRITANQFIYAPTGALPAVLEDDSLSGGHPFTAGEANTVCNNNPINPSGSSAIEFTKAAGSGSVVYATTVWF